MIIGGATIPIGRIKQFGIWFHGPIRITDRHHLTVQIQFSVRFEFVRVTADSPSDLAYSSHW